VGLEREPEHSRGRPTARVLGREGQETTSPSQIHITIKEELPKSKKGNRESIGIAATKKTHAAPNNGKDIKTKHGTVAAANGTATVDDERGGGITLTRVVIQSLLMDVFFGDELPTESSNVDFRAGVTVPGTAGRRVIVSIEIAN